MSLRFQIDLIKSVIDFLGFLLPVDSSQPGVEVEVFFDCESRPEDVKLRTDSHLQMYLIDLFPYAMTSDEGRAGCRSKNACYHRKKSGFSSSVGS